MDNGAVKQKNKRLLLMLSGLVVGMFAFGFALVPLYELICQVTGVQSIAQRQVIGDQPAEISVVGNSQRTLKVKLDTSIHPSLPWRFDLQQPAVMEVKVGEVYEVVFKANNRSNDPVTAQAIPSVAPWQANAYFNKLECFCFNRQTLAGGEQTEMPLRFVVSPKLPEGINSITLSYNIMKLEDNTLAQLAR
ncbi:MAG: cytochrome c oxidase assembly protein [Motiliproteus sp.]|nr:cytochrome c oxidase assembly protein [Motiliproteus sp.]MCW9053955.1 cytochrome c oxidase assembly protein [Motiliproteus sp.]